MLKISFVSEALPTQGVAVLTVAAGQKLGEIGTKFDRKTGGALRRAMVASAFKGEKAHTLTIMTPTKTRLAKLVLVGIGKPQDAKEVTFEHVGGAAAVALQGRDVAQATLIVDEHKGLILSAAEAAAHAGYGAQLRFYRFDKYRTTLKTEQKQALKSLSVGTHDVTGARKAFVPLEKVAESVFLTRDLVAEPANILYPETLAKRCLDLKSQDLKVEVFDERQLAKLGMGALLGVAQGSARSPRLVTLIWKGNSSAKDKRPVVFVGKGVTFDTGGISLKSPGGMGDMKHDMAGAGAVIGAMKALASRKAKVNAVGVIGLVENMPSGTAQRPGDIVKSMSGQTIEVLNTDAEGRLVLADAVWYAQEKFNPRYIIDLATLTGAISIALGREYAGLFSNDDKLAEHLYRAGEAVEEPLWRFPMGEAYDRMLDSQMADVKNISNTRDAGSITGAQFIKRFVKKNAVWAHIDIAGVAERDKDRPTCPKGPTAFGVRLLDRFVADYCEEK